MNGTRPEADSQWEVWSQAWVAETATEGTSNAFDELRRRAARQRRRQWLVVGGEVVLVVVLAALSAAVLIGERRPWHVVWLASLWGFTAVAAGFSWWNRRSTWRASGETVEAYVRLARLRAERHLRSLRFAVLLFAAEVPVVVAQLLWFDRLVPWAVALLAAAGVVLLGWCAHSRRRVREEHDRIAAFERELGGGG
jgi:hypothetical protein